MAKYTIEIDVDEGQDKYLKDKASTELKEVEDILLEQVEEKVKGQINQWIRDKVTVKLEGITPADALARLSYFDKD